MSDQLSFLAGGDRPCLYPQLSDNRYGTAAVREVRHCEARCSVFSPFCDEEGCSDYG